MSNMLRMHPSILSISELWMSLANRGFVHGAMDGPGFWRLLTTPAPAQAPVFQPPIYQSPTVGIFAAGSPNRDPIISPSSGFVGGDLETSLGMAEYLYDHSREGALPIGSVPPLMTIVLPHLTDTPEAALDALAPHIRTRPHAPVADHYHHLFQLLMAMFGKTRWVERSGASVIFAPPILRLFPDAKIVHLTRDGRETALSMARHGGLRMFMRAWVQFQRVGIDILRPPTLMGDSRLLYWLEKLGLWFINPEKAMSRPVSLDLAGRFWSAMVVAGLETIHRLPDHRLLTLRYEDLVRQPRTAMQDFADFMGQDPGDARWLDTASGLPKRQPPKWQALPPNDQASLSDACAPGMAALGYSTDGL